MCKHRFKYYVGTISMIYNIHPHPVSPRACLNREGPARNGDDRAAVEVAGKLIAVHSGTHEDEP